MTPTAVLCRGLRLCNRSLPVLAITLTLYGCGAQSDAFSARFPDNRKDHAAALAQALREVPSPVPQQVAVGVTPPPTRIFGVDVDGQRVLWQQATGLDQAPMLAGDLVVLQHDDQIKAFDLRSGQLVHAFSADGLRLIGTAGDGATAVLTLSHGNGTTSASQVVLLQGDRIAWRRNLDQRVGGPAQAGDLVLVPWGSQFLSALHTDSGVEFARLRVNDGVLAQAFFAGGKAYAGGPDGAVRVDDAIGRGTMRGTGFLRAPTAQLPGRPVFIRDVYGADGVLRPDSAGHSIQLLWTPGEPGHLGRDTLYLVFYRFVVALSYPELQPRWVYTHPADIVGARAFRDELRFADRSGRFVSLDLVEGEARTEFATDLPATAVVLPRDPSHDAEAAPPPASGSPELRQQLRAAAADPDARLVPLRRFAVAQLAQLEDPNATSDLLALCNESRLVTAVQEDACDALAHRDQGRELLVSALDRHYDFLAETEAPPVGALARAALALDAKEAYPALVSHLEDPQTKSSALPDVVKAIATLNPAQATVPLSDFCHRYHADPVDEHVVQAVEEAIVALFTVQGPLAIETLIDLAEDKLSLSGVRDKAAASLTQLEEAAQLARRHEPVDDEDGQAVPEEGEPEEREPDRLTPSVVERTLRPVKRELRACLSHSAGNVFHGRMILVVRDGEVELVSVTPSELQHCVESLVREQAFPKTRQAGRQQVSYELRRK